jgi:hypothetical protein
MRLGLTAVLVIGLSAAAAAQSSTPRSMTTAPRGTIGLPLPEISLPLSPIGLPLPPSGLPPIGVSAAPAVPHRGPSSPRVGPRVPSRARRPAAIFFVPVGGFGYPASAGAPGPPAVSDEQEPPTGTLRLELQPGVVPQVFVDGYYVGTLDDVNGELTLDPGPHGLELRADGYESLAFGVQISAGRSITYRGTLNALTVAPPPVARVAASQLPPPATIYVIPGCYVGNVPPRDAKLPASCDTARATTLAPLKR